MLVALIITFIQLRSLDSAETPEPVRQSKRKSAMASARKTTTSQGPKRGRQTAKRGGPKSQGGNRKSQQNTGRRGRNSTSTGEASGENTKKPRRYKPGT